MSLKRDRRRLLAGAALVCTFAIGHASAETPAVPPGGDIPAEFKAETASFDYERQDVMIPMRDGVKLHTVILRPKGVSGKLPILLTRTPYGADKSAGRNDSTHLQSVLPTGDDIVAVSGYIRVFQDVRGKYGSEGEYVMNRPMRGPLNPTKVDHSTDTWDTIDWLVKTVPDNNGRVGMIGTSYPGFLVLAGMIDPHPALKAAVPINPMVDTWMGDDWFHNGAFRQAMLDYVYQQTATRKSSEHPWRGGWDDYDAYLAAGSAGAFGKRLGMDQLPFFRRLTEHPAYDDFWRLQAMDRLLAKEPLKVPTLYVSGLWDQEDIYGAVAAYEAVEPKDANNDLNFLVIGPWRHGGSNGDGSQLGAIRFNGDNALWFRKSVLQPWLDERLKPGAPKADVAPVTAFETGTNTWRRYDRWPRACAENCPATSKPLYLEAGFKLGFDKPAVRGAFDEYVSDPAKPVPYRLRPVRPMYGDGSTWKQWLVDDQRNFANRTDVLTYVTEPLTAPVQISGQPVANLFASTSGSDSDWVVKLIDVYPDEVPAQPEMGGYQLMVSADILRGRYRNDPSKPEPVKPGSVERYRFALPTANHVFLPGHRIMVQVQSSWFPLYDRNPQTWVKNVFWAWPADYAKATQRVYRSNVEASFVDLPVVEAP